MKFLLTHFWAWIVGAFALGCLVGAMTWSRAQRACWTSPWLVVAGLAFAIGLALALTTALRGRTGLWLEIALLLLPAYLIGCLVGAGLRTLLAPPEHPLVLVGAEAAKPPHAREPSQRRVAAAAPLAAVASAEALAVTTAATSAAPRASNALLAPDPQPAIAPASHPGRRPPAAVGEGRDPLGRIRGLSAQDIERLHMAGVTRFSQIAALDPLETQWLDSWLGAQGRIRRDRWIEQARFWAQAQRNERAAQAAVGASPAVPILARSDQALKTAADATAAAATATALAAMAASHSRGPIPVAANLGDIESRHPGKRPPGLPRPRDDRPDDLLKIKGVGRANIQQLHALGIFHFDQIARWSKEELRWVGGFLAYPGGPEKDDWIGQAKFYARRLEIEIANRAATERYRRD